MRRRVLGKGLEALIPTGLKEEGIIEIEVDEISPNIYQPRKSFDSEKLKELIASIKEKGVVQPIIVRPKDKGYELIAGERRWRAVKEAGLRKIPAIIRDVSNTEALELALIENLQREDLNPIEEAEAYKRLIEEFHLTQDELAKRVGKDRSSIANTLRLLKLPEKVQENVSRGTISMGHARALLGLEEPQAQEMVCQRIIKGGLSVREAERMVNRIKAGVYSKKVKTLLKRDPHLLSIEEELKRTFGTQVRIRQIDGKGKIEIEYYTKEDLERILEILNIKL